VASNKNLILNNIACKVLHWVYLNQQLARNLINSLAIQDNLIEAEVGELSGRLASEVEAENTNNSGDKYSRCLALWVWLTKALVLRENKAGEKFASKLIEWLDRPVISEKCSEAFGTIVNNEAGHGSVMTNKKAAHVRLLFRQRFFERTVHALKAKFDSEEPVHKCKLAYFIM